jgi:hypothetical protein
MSAFYGAFIGAAGWPGTGGAGPGGDAPEWVRAGAFADIDFVNVPPRAWISGVGEISDFSTIFGESALLPNHEYDPLLLDSGVGYGLGAEDQGVGTFAGALVSAFNYGFSAIVEFDDIFGLEYTEATFATDFVINYSPAQLSLTDSGTFGLYMPDESLGTAGAHKLGFTLTASEGYGSVDNTQLDGYPPVGEDKVTVMDPTTPNQPTDIIFHCAKLKRLTTYTPVKTELELKALTA